MEFSEVVRRRRMSRRFDGRAVPRAMVETILRVALRAPSAGFVQGIDFVVLTDESARARFFDAASEPAWRAERADRDGVLFAPVIVVPVADPAAYRARYDEEDKARTMLHGRAPSQWPVPYWTVDASFAVMLILLKAAEEGLGSLFFQLHGEPERVSEALALPAGRELIGAIALGYPRPSSSTSPARRPRRSFEETVHFERF